MHAASLKGSEEKLFMFLSGWMNGPQLFVEKFGHPKLRQRHMPFAIGDKERDQWMQCMTQAMNDVVEDEGLRKELIAALARWRTLCATRIREPVLCAPSPWAGESCVGWVERSDTQQRSATMGIALLNPSYGCSMA